MTNAARCLRPAFRRPSLFPALTAPAGLLRDTPVSRASIPAGKTPATVSLYRGRRQSQGPRGDCIVSKLHFCLYQRYPYWENRVFRKSTGSRSLLGKREPGVSAGRENGRQFTVPNSLPVRICVSERHAAWPRMALKHNSIGFLAQNGSCVWRKRQFMWARLVQFLKARALMTSMESGSVMDTSEVLPMKACTPISFTVRPWKVPETVTEEALPVYL